ncbi:MAG: hypothetical protein FWF75_01855 [Propionibacteriaceae bacterium]|nr:hypothetical protein [Propionibacteriaceae bacterium]
MKQDLLLAAQLVDSDPEAALEHALSARDLAPRLSAVREAVAETAYAVEDYATALNEYRTLHRMTGDADYIPVMADCERALGHPEAALRLLQGVTQQDVSAEQYVEVLLETAGARDDCGQRDEASRLLRQAISEKVGDRAGQARLRYAYADLLERSGSADGAREWFVAAASLDDEDELDAEERLERLDGVVLEIDESDDDESEDDEFGDDDGSEADGAEADQFGDDESDDDGSEADGAETDQFDDDESDDELDDDESEDDEFGDDESDDDGSEADGAEADQFDDGESDDDESDDELDDGESDDDESEADESGDDEFDDDEFGDDDSDDDESDDELDDDESEADEFGDDESDDEPDGESGDEGSGADEPGDGAAETADDADEQSERSAGQLGDAPEQADASTVNDGADAEASCDSQPTLEQEDPAEDIDG